jgi:hypothetical protein
MPLGPQTANIAGGQTTPGGGSYTTIILVYGTNASNAVSYSVATVSAGSAISSAKFNQLISTVNQERVRRGSAATSIAISVLISAADIDQIQAALEIPGPAADQAYEPTGTLSIVTFPQISAPSGFTTESRGNGITAANVNALITELNNAGAVCTCNCNYCTCNCNYCTCNCNYSCTCNCNYSDERVKSNIEYM